MRIRLRSRLTQRAWFTPVVRVFATLAGAGLASMLMPGAQLPGTSPVTLAGSIMGDPTPDTASAPSSTPAHAQKADAHSTATSPAHSDDRRPSAASVTDAGRTSEPRVVNDQGHVSAAEPDAGSRRSGSQGPREGTSGPGPSPGITHQDPSTAANALFNADWRRAHAAYEVLARRDPHNRAFGSIVRILRHKLADNQSVQPQGSRP